jgi:hypothetical protein
MPCRRSLPGPRSRRDFLLQAGNGFGAFALTGLLKEAAFGGHLLAADAPSPLATQPTHFPPTAKSVIFLYMDGGPSSMDTFDPKPRLTADHGKPFAMKIQATQFDNVGTTFGCPWKFHRYGESGLPVSDLFPHTAQCVDDMCFVRSMTAPFPEHTTANYFLHTGFGMPGRPSMGAWAAYGLGSESQNLPGYVVVNSGAIPPGGIECFGSGFLPATFQGSVFKGGSSPIADVKPSDSAPVQRRKLAFMNELDRGILGRIGHNDAIESAIANQELAFRMQTAIPDLMDISQETRATQEMYGCFGEWQGTQRFGRACLAARRLVERGVRFIQLTCPDGNGDRWDQHSDIVDGHTKNAKSVDQPIAALLTDLKARGLLDETLVLWAGEFGRTPFAQGSTGRDHNPFGFTVWMAGGGIKGGMSFGETDEFGYYAVENRVELHDLHATMLHCLGLDHTRLTYRFSGRDMRLTDVFGNVMAEVLKNPSMG